MGNHYEQFLLETGCRQRVIQPENRTSERISTLFVDGLLISLLAVRQTINFHTGTCKMHNLWSRHLQNKSNIVISTTSEQRET
jgi:hypothetical protein